MALFSGWGEDGVTTFCSAWFDTVWGVNITDLCYDHDAAYTAGTVALKIKGDFRLLKGIIGRADRSDCAAPLMMMATGAGMYAAVTTAGWLWWLRDKIRGEDE